MRSRRPPPAQQVHMGQAVYAPLVDMLTILLFFILKSFSMDTPVRPEDPDFRLPASSANDAVARLPAIDITPEAIYLGGERVAATGYYAERPDQLIQELYDQLSGRPPPRLNVRADGRVPYVVLRKVLFTAQEAGVDHLDLVAVSRAGL